MNGRCETTLDHDALRGRRGFTLLEVLIATLIFSLILAAMNITFYSAMHLQASTSALAESTIPLNHAVSVIKGDLGGILVTGGTLAGPVTGTAPGMGAGLSGQLQLYTTTGVLDDVQPWGDVQLISYYLQDMAGTQKGPGARCLVRAVTRNLLSTGNPDVWEQPLLRGVNSLEFSFYDGAVWTTSWDSTTQTAQVPRAIKVYIEFAADEQGRPGRLPVEMVVPIVMQGPTNAVTAASGTMVTGGSK